MYTGRMDWDDEDTLVRHNAPPSLVEDKRPYLSIITGPNLGVMVAVDDEVRFGRNLETGVALTDSEVSREHAEIRCVGNKIVLRDLGSTNGTYLNGVRLLGDDERELSDGDKVILGTKTVLKLSYHDALDAQFQKRMMSEALRDSLTGAYSVSFFRERLEEEFAYAERHDREIALLMLDIDHFKKVNDNFGHLAGDAVLTEVAACVAGTIRREDVFARYGGEEFAVLTRGISVDGAMMLAERIRHTVERQAFVLEGQHVGVTLSIGVLAYPHYRVKTARDMIARADRAMYRAKEQGRNQVMLAVSRDQNTPVATEREPDRVGRGRTVKTQDAIAPPRRDTQKLKPIKS